MKIVSLNVERNKHLDTVIPFLQREKPEVLCLMEVMELSVPTIASSLGMHATFAPLTILNGWEEDVRGCVLGTALLTREPHTVLGIPYYHGDGNNLGTLNEKYSDEEAHAAIARPVILAEVHGTISCTVGVIYFTYSTSYTVNGQPDDAQRESLQKLLSILTPYQDLLLCGDFNIPRGTELYDVLCAHFTDTIPLTYESSLDPVLHRKHGLKYVVDYMWTRGAYTVEGVTLHSGISDHCAVVGTVAPASVL